jgi:hypothetical protein
MIEKNNEECISCKAKLKGILTTIWLYIGILIIASFIAGFATFGLLNSIGIIGITK